MYHIVDALALNSGSAAPLHTPEGCVSDVCYMHTLLRAHHSLLALRNSRQPFSSPLRSILNNEITDKMHKDGTKQAEKGSLPSV